MAEKTGCLIVPMAISGSADILEAHFPKVKPVHVIVEYGKPIDPKSLDKDTRKKIGSHCQGVIAEMLEKNKLLLCKHSIVIKNKESLATLSRSSGAVYS